MDVGKPTTKEHWGKKERGKETKKEREREAESKIPSYGGGGDENYRELY